MIDWHRGGPCAEVMLVHSVAIAIGAVIATVIVGESGSAAVWTGSFG